MVPVINPVPVIVIGVSVKTEPLSGLILVIDGPEIYVNAPVLVTDPPPVVTTTSFAPN